MGGEAGAGPGGRTVIVVDDHADVTDLVRIVLERAGYQVRCTATAEAALGFVEAMRPDLVISDVYMPGMGGIALAERLRSRRDPVPVLLMSVDHFLPDDGVAFLPKPFALAALVAMVGSTASGAAGRR